MDYRIVVTDRDGGVYLEILANPDELNLATRETL